MNLNHGDKIHSPTLNVSSLFGEKLTKFASEVKSKATGVFPASKKELRADNTALIAKDSLQDAIIDALVKQVNSLSPVCPCLIKALLFPDDTMISLCTSLSIIVHR